MVIITGEKKEGVGVNRGRERGGKRGERKIQNIYLSLSYIVLPSVNSSGEANVITISHL